MFDPILGEEVHFLNLSIDISFHDILFSMSFLKSGSSMYERKLIQLGFETSEETLDSKTWNKTFFEREKLDEKTFKVEKIPLLSRFCEYNLQTKVPLVFENYHAYFNLKRSHRSRKTKRHHYHLDFSTSKRDKIFEGFENRTFPENIDGKYSSYLSETEYYDFSREEFSELISNLRERVSIRKEATQGEIINWILEGIHNTIRYDDSMFGKGLENRMKASETIKRGGGVCQHFSAVFVSLSRALGIPARQISGFAQGGDFTDMHAWVEILVDGDKWLPLEPQNSRSEHLSWRWGYYFPFAVNLCYEESSPEYAFQTAQLFRHFEVQSKDANCMSINPLLAEIFRNSTLL